MSFLKLFEIIIRSINSTILNTKRSSFRCDSVSQWNLSLAACTSPWEWYTRRMIYSPNRTSWWARWSVKNRIEVEICVKCQIKRYEKTHLRSFPPLPPPPPPPPLPHPRERSALEFPGLLLMALVNGSSNDRKLKTKKSEHMISFCQKMNESNYLQVFYCSYKSKKQWQQSSKWPWLLAINFAIYKIGTNAKYEEWILALNVFVCGMTSCFWLEPGNEFKKEVKRNSNYLMQCKPFWMFKSVWFHESNKQSKIENEKKTMKEISQCLYFDWRL